MKTLNTTGQHLQQFFTRLAFDDSISYEILLDKAKNEEEVLLGEFMSNYSHNNSDYCFDELLKRINESFPELDYEDKQRFHNSCQGFCELFEGEYEVCSFNVLGEINYICERLEEKKQFELELEE